MNYLDLDTWPRRDHFYFFRGFDEPFFGITVRVDCTAAYRHCKGEGQSFFLYYLHRCLAAINAVEPFRYRIEGERVAIYDRINVSATIGRADGTFDFSYIPYDPDFATFRTAAEGEIARIRAGSGLNPGVSGQDVVHFSAAPWLDFTALSHARHYGREDSCTKISVGKVTERDGRLGMPVAIHGHHALLDGLHVGQFVEEFQRLMDGVTPVPSSGSAGK